MNKVVIAAGLNGSGKSSVSKVAKSKGYTVVNWGDLMVETALQRKLVTNRDQMRHLALPVQDHLQIEAARRILEMQGKILVDTHYAIPVSKKSFIRGLPNNILDILKPVKFVEITAPTWQIFLMRFLERYVAPLLAMPARKRELSIPFIIKHQQTSHQYAEQCSEHANAQLVTIQNLYGKKNLAKARDKFLEIIP